jgi:phage head maturation protease
MNEQIERRFVVHGLQVEQRADGKMPMLKGYAAVFNLPSVELWGFYEQIAPGAFADSIAAGDDVRALWNHDPNWVMARTTNGMSGAIRLAGMMRFTPIPAN